MKDKLNSEDALKAQAEADKQLLNKEFQQKLKEAIEKAKNDEQAKAKIELEKK